MRNLELILVLALSTYFGQCQNNHDSPYSIKLFHDFSLPPRAENWEESFFITIKNVNTGSVNIETLYTNETSLKLLELGLKNRLYRAKAVVTTYKGKEVEFRTFSKANGMILRNANITFVCTLDFRGSIMAINLKTFVPKNVEHEILSDPIIKPEIKFRSSEAGPVPDTVSYLQKIERERDAKEKGAPHDNRSFLSKYWLYIVLLVVFAVLSGSAQSENTQGNR